MRSIRFLLTLGVPAFAAAFFSAGEARAAVTINVDSNCTIQQAFHTLSWLVPAGGCEVGTGTGDTVQLGATTYNVSQPLEVRQRATIKGSASGVTKIVAVNLEGSELLYVNNGTFAGPGNLDVIVEDVTLDGSATTSQINGVYAVNFDPNLFVDVNLWRVHVTNFSLGGLDLYDASLFMIDSFVEYNSSPEDGGGIRLVQGPDTFENVSLDLTNCLIASNTAAGDGGGIYSEVAGNANIRATTLSNNFAANQGGGLFSNNANYLHTHYTTIAFNSAGQAGGGFAAGSSNSFNFNSSIVAENGGPPSAPDGYTPGSNTVGFYDSVIGNDAGVHGVYSYNGPSLQNVNPLLDSGLYDLGGPVHTRVHRLLPGSPAIDYFFTGTGRDQRGYPAPRDGDGNGSKIRDLGAYEYDPNLQTEMLLVAQKSADAHVVAQTTTGDTSTTYSNALGTNLQSNGTNDFVTYAVPVPATGSYNVKVRVRKGNNRGKFQLAWSNSPSGPFTPIGVAQDLYVFGSSTPFVELNVNPTAPTSIGSLGTNYFRFFVTGKNTQSLGYQLFLDTIKLTKL